MSAETYQEIEILPLQPSVELLQNTPLRFSYFDAIRSYNSWNTDHPELTVRGTVADRERSVEIPDRITNFYNAVALAGKPSGVPFDDFGHYTSSSLKAAFQNAYTDRAREVARGLYDVLVMQGSSPDIKGGVARVVLAADIFAAFQQDVTERLAHKSFEEPINAEQSGLALSGDMHDIMRAFKEARNNVSVRYPELFQSENAAMNAIFHRPYKNESIFQRFYRTASGFWSRDRRESPRTPLTPVSQNGSLGQGERMVIEQRTSKDIIMQTLKKYFPNIKSELLSDIASPRSFSEVDFANAPVEAVALDRLAQYIRSQELTYGRDNDDLHDAPDFYLATVDYTAALPGKNTSSERSYVWGYNHGSQTYGVNGDLQYFPDSHDRVKDKALQQLEATKDPALHERRLFDEKVHTEGMREPGLQIHEIKIYTVRIPKAMLQ